MACLNEPLLSAYLDGALGSGELDTVVGHLESCPACLRIFHDVKTVRAAVRTMPMVDPPQSLVDAVGAGPWSVPVRRRRVPHPGPQLSAYLDGELTTGEADTLGAHLATCSVCRIELQELDGARTAIRALPRLEPPPRVLSSHPVGEDTPRRPRPLLTYAASLAAVAAALVIGLVLLDSPEPPRPIDLDRLVVHHNARQSVEVGFSVIPVGAAEPAP